MAAVAARCAPVSSWIVFSMFSIPCLLMSHWYQVMCHRRDEKIFLNQINKLHVVSIFEAHGHAECFSQICFIKLT